MLKPAYGTTLCKMSPFQSENIAEHITYHQRTCGGRVLEKTIFAISNSPDLQGRHDSDVILEVWQQETTYCEVEMSRINNGSAAKW
jgi:hypothetical protein